MHTQGCVLIGVGLDQEFIRNEKDNKVIPDPIDDRKFQEWNESG